MHHQLHTVLCLTVQGLHVPRNKTVGLSAAGPFTGTLYICMNKYTSIWGGGGGETQKSVVSAGSVDKIKFKRR